MGTEAGGVGPDMFNASMLKASIEDWEGVGDEGRLEDTSGRLYAVTAGGLVVELNEVGEGGDNGAWAQLYARCCEETEVDI